MIALNKINHRLRGRANNQLFGSNHRVSFRRSREVRERLGFEKYGNDLVTMKCYIKGQKLKMLQNEEKKRAWDSMTLSYLQT